MAERRTITERDWMAVNDQNTQGGSVSILYAVRAQHTIAFHGISEGGCRPRRAQPKRSNKLSLGTARRSSRLTWGSKSSSSAAATAARLAALLRSGSCPASDLRSKCFGKWRALVLYCREPSSPTDDLAKLRRLAGFLSLHSAIEAYSVLLMSDTRP